MRIKVNEQVPSGYRAVWFDGPKDQYVCVRYGFHWFVKLYYKLWVWSRRYTPGDLEIRDFKAYKQGYADGQAGREEKFVAFNKDLDAYLEENNDPH